MQLDYNSNGNGYPNPVDSFEDENMVECFQCGEQFDCEGYVEIETCSPECESEYKECEKEFRNDLKQNR